LGGLPDAGLLTNPPNARLAALCDSFDGPHRSRQDALQLRAGTPMRVEFRNLARRRCAEPV
jgi:hypothetical protein